MYSGNRHCFTCGKSHCGGHSVPPRDLGKKHVEHPDLDERPRKVESQEEFDEFLREIEMQEAECNRLLIDGKIGPLEHWKFRNQLEDLRRRKDTSRRIGMAERAAYNKIHGKGRKATIADLKAKEARV